MSVSFRLKYLLGFIPSAQKLDAAWDKLVAMRDNLSRIEASPELSRYNELKSLIESADFQHKKRDITGADFKQSSEFRLLQELKNLEKQKRIKQYFQLLSSADLAKFNKLADSDKMGQYRDLKTLVESPEFAKRKKEIESIDYKHSPEFKLQQEYQSLKNDERLKHYYKTIASSEYLHFMELEPLVKKGKVADDEARMKVYHQFLKSKDYDNLKAVENANLPDRFEELKLKVASNEFTEREAYLKNPKRYESTMDFAKVKEYQSLEASDEIKFYKRFEHTALYKNYLQVKDSKDLKRLEELRVQTSAEAFKQKVNYLKDKNRYKTTEEFKLEDEFNRLKNSVMMHDYQKLKNARELQFFSQWDIAFEDNFKDEKLDTQVWMPGNYWGMKSAGVTFSQENELQAYNGLKNIQVHNNTLTIFTKKEKVEGKIWKMNAGLVPAQFDYSSAMMNCAESFRMGNGVVEVKVRFGNEASVTNALSLTGEKPFPQFDVFRSGKNNVGLGLVDKSGIGKSAAYTHISGLKPNEYHIYRLELTSNELVWKINGYEVLRQHYTAVKEGLFFNFVSSLHAPVNDHALPHRFEIDWVRCFVSKG